MTSPLTPHPSRERADTLPPTREVLDPSELLFWTLMRRFEALALDRYVTHAVVLATPAKRHFVSALVETTPHDLRLAEHGLDRPIDALLATAESPTEVVTLIVQGLVLERLGQAIYGIVMMRDQTVSTASRTLAKVGDSASRSVTELVAGRLQQAVDTADQLWATFAEASLDVVGALDDLADPVDRVFGKRFGLHFSEVMGEFTADLIVACTELGMPRRKVVAHLAGAAMGL